MSLESGFCEDKELWEKIYSLNILNNNDSEDEPLEHDEIEAELSHQKLTINSKTYRNIVLNCITEVSLLESLNILIPPLAEDSLEEFLIFLSAHEHVLNLPLKYYSLAENPLHQSLFLNYLLGEVMASRIHVAKTAPKPQKDEIFQPNYCLEILFEILFLLLKYKEFRKYRPLYFSPKNLPQEISVKFIRQMLQEILDFLTNSNKAGIFAGQKAILENENFPDSFLNGNQWVQLFQIHKILEKEYSSRKEVLKKRLQVSLQSFSKSKIVSHDVEYFFRDVNILKHRLDQLYCENHPLFPFQIEIMNLEDLNWMIDPFQPIPTELFPSWEGFFESGQMNRNYFRSSGISKDLTYFPSLLHQRFPDRGGRLCAGKPDPEASENPSSNDSMGKLEARKRANSSHGSQFQKSNKSARWKARKSSKDEKK